MDSSRVVIFLMVFGSIFEYLTILDLDCLRECWTNNLLREIY